ncbi:MAG: hypothetical protein ACRCV0_02930, partial [Brevinema sp.]
YIKFNYKLCIIAILLAVPHALFGQYKWTVYSGDPTFKTLEDSIDNGRIIYHKDAENNSTTTGNRGVLFETTFFAFPSLTGSFAWSQVRVNVGKLSFYPHIFTLDRGTSTLAIAILYNISRVSPVRGIRTRPSFTPASLLQLEKEKMNFTKIKFVSEGFATELVLQSRNQETELSLSDYDVNYNYWLKSTPNQKEVVDLRTFFARPLKLFKVRAYSDKGYLDTTLTGLKVQTLGDVFVKSIDLYQRLVDPNYVNKPTNTVATNAKTNATPRRTPTKTVRSNTQKVQRKVVTTNQRPAQRRVVRPS